MAINMTDDVVESIKKFVKEHPFITIGTVATFSAIAGYAIAKNSKKIDMLIKAGTTGVVDKLLSDLYSKNGPVQEILLCDSWISAATLRPFSIFKGKTKVLKILTFNVAESHSTLQSYIEGFTTVNSITVEIRKTATAHDRYLLYGNNCFLFGASLKDVGKKDTTITQDNASSGTFRSLFLVRWRESGNRFENGNWTTIPY